MGVKTVLKGIKIKWMETQISCKDHKINYRSKKISWEGARIWLSGQEIVSKEKSQWFWEMKTA